MGFEYLIMQICNGNAMYVTSDVNTLKLLQQTEFYLFCVAFRFLVDSLIYTRSL